MLCKCSSFSAILQKGVGQRRGNKGGNFGKLGVALFWMGSTFAEMDGWIAVALFLPLIGGLLLGPVGARWRRQVGWIALAFPILSFLAIVAAGLSRGDSGAVVVEWPWVPSLGISLSFLVDGLSILFGLIVSGVGILVFCYATQYFDGDEPGLNRFYAYLVLFMAAMLGTVFADNLILLFIFWELTGITSFLLIGFLHDKEASRVGARMALLVTVFTGLFTLVGFIGVGVLAGTYSLETLLAGGMPGGVDGWAVNAFLLLILVGAFGKSAQFPFHFWLPRAMEAPTPVSAYLHSATMVKLGVFLVARLFPVFSEAAVWYPVLTLVGFGTMAWAAFLALRSNQLKAILAYSTVTQLGALIGVYGLSSQTGLFGDFYHILDHVFYKASLFMVAGIVTHCTGLKDIRQLGGLRQAMPVTAVAAAIGCASMAGVPLTMGFVSKEMILADMTQVALGGSLIAWVALGLLGLATFFKVAFAARFWFNLFAGPVPEEAAKHLHRPSLALQIPPAILAGLSVLMGLILPLADHLIHGLNVAAMHMREGHLAMWHGLTIDLLISLGLLGAGWWLYTRGRAADWRWAEIPAWMRFDLGFEAFVKGFNEATVRITRFLRSESPPDYLLVIVGTIVLVSGGFLVQAFMDGEGAAFQIADWSFDGYFLRVMATIIIGLACVGVVFLTQWTSQLILLSTAGYLTTFLFVIYRAPDLALTQILVESATLILILLLLGRFPKSAQSGEDRDRGLRPRNILNLLVSLGLGTVVTFTILIANAVEPETRLGTAILEQTKGLAEGTNAVNTILVDFRGFDTLGEISVLVIAVLGSIGLFFRYKRSERERRQRALGAPGFGIFHSQPKGKEERS